MKGVQKDAGRISLPPRLPQNRRELERAIILLGCRKQAELNIRTRQKLEGLIGIYPTTKEATLWKQVLRQACRENGWAARREEPR